jgi:hypothetical protein
MLKQPDKQKLAKFLMIFSQPIMKIRRRRFNDLRLFSRELGISVEDRRGIIDASRSTPDLGDLRCEFWRLGCLPISCLFVSVRRTPLFRLAVKTA